MIAIISDLLTSLGELELSFHFFVKYNIINSFANGSDALLELLIGCN